MQNRKLISTAVVLCLTMSVPSYGQFGLGKKGDASDKEAARLKKEEERDAKNLRSYDKVKAFAIDKYASDPDFREEVDQSFAELLRDHKMTAFMKNTHRGSKIVAISEDRFRWNDQGELYDNLLVQSRINRIGQMLVPKDSDRVFAFRLTADPTPVAETLATGTIYISTGIISLLDNEAQLSYVLAHEMAHVQLDHWKQKAMMRYGVEAYNAEQAKKAERIGVAIGLAGALTGGLAKGASGALAGGAIGLAGGMIAGALLNRQAVVNWDKAQEDEADKLAFKAMLNAEYDVREVPKLYALMENVVVKDSRVSLGFLGERNRIRERKDQAQKLITDAYKAEIDTQLKGKGFRGDSGQHRNLMAELKRDNGIMAYYNDMFEVARKNLEEATAIRDNDPAAQYYFGKVLETIGRTPEDRKLAEQSFVKAVQFDSRSENFGAHLHRALMMIEDQNTANPTQLTGELNSYTKNYVQYQIDQARALLLPPNINTIAEYMEKYGMAGWKPEMPAEANDVRISPAMLMQQEGLRAAPASSATSGQALAPKETEKKTPTLPAGLPGVPRVLPKK